MKDVPSPLQLLHIGSMYYSVTKNIANYVYPINFNFYFSNKTIEDTDTKLSLLGVGVSDLYSPHFV